MVGWRELIRWLERFFSFYEELFQSKGCSFLCDLDMLIDPVANNVEDELLCAISLVKEIKKMTFSMGSCQVSGLDGLCSIFYKHYWNIVVAKMVNFVQALFRGGFFL